MRFLSSLRLLRAALVLAWCATTSAHAGSSREALFIPDTTSGNIYEVENGASYLFADGFSFPTAIANINNTGNFYVSDYLNQNIYKVNQHGVVSFFAGVASPSGIALSAGSGNLYAVSNGNSIYEITPGGSTSVFASSFGAFFASGLAIDQADNLYVTDIATNSIFKITAGGVASTFATGLSNPLGIAFDAYTGNIFVANGANATIAEYTPGGAGFIFASGVTNPSGLAFDQFGNLYVSQNGGNISKITSDGTVSLYAVTGLTDPRYMTFAPVPEASTIAWLAGLGVTATTVIIRRQRRK